MALKMLSVPPEVMAPACSSIAVDLAHLVAVQHLADHGQHFRLELGAARAQVALQQVDEGVQAEDLVQEGVVLHAAVVHGAGALPAQPLLVLLLGHVGELFQDLFLVPALLGQPGEDLEELVVGMHIPKEIEGYLVRQTCFPRCLGVRLRAMGLPQALFSACKTGRIFSLAAVNCAYMWS